MYELKKPYQLFLSLLLCMSTLIAFNSLMANEHDFDEDWQEDFEALDIPERTLSLHGDSCISACSIVEMLTNPDEGIELQKILLNDFYKATNTINVRSLLDSPQYYFYNCFDKNFFINTFYNQTSRGYYTIDGTEISSYLNFNQPGIIAALSNFCPDINIPSLVTLIEPFKIQERRAGFMFGGRYVNHNWYAKYYFPLYYLERNLFLNDQEKQRLENALDLDTGKEADAEGNRFAREHLVTDRVGFGDTRLVVGNRIFENKDLMLNVGGIATIPTAFAFSKGLYGSHFLKNSAHPTFNLQQILSMCLCNPAQMNLEGAQELAVAFALSAVDKLTANLLDRSLGNNGHVGLGAFIEPHHTVEDDVHLKGRVCVEYLMPAQEKRFYIQTKNPADFLDRNYTDCALADENLCFLNEQLIQTLIPCVYDTTVWPGVLLKATGQFNYIFAKKWWVAAGGDLWFQSKEHFGKINAPDTVRTLLRTDIAQRPHAVQAKFFAWLDYKTKKKDWCVSFYIDGTWASFGIGKDFTLAIRCEKAL